VNRRRRGTQLLPYSFRIAAVSRRQGVRPHRVSDALGRRPPRPVSGSMASTYHSGIVLDGLERRLDIDQRSCAGIHACPSTSPAAISITADPNVWCRKLYRARSRPERRLPDVSVTLTVEAIATPPYLRLRHTLTFAFALARRRVFKRHRYRRGRLYRHRIQWAVA